MWPSGERIDVCIFSVQPKTGGSFHVLGLGDRKGLFHPPPQFNTLSATFFMKFSKIFISIAFLALLFGCNETMTNRYANYQEAVEDNLFERDWVPDVLPINTEQIIETHNIDTNERCAEAVVPIDSLPRIMTSLKINGFINSDSKLPELPAFRFALKACTFNLERISRNRTVHAKSNEIVVLDIEASKFYYWSF